MVLQARKFRVQRFLVVRHHHQHLKGRRSRSSTRYLQAGTIEPPSGRYCRRFREAHARREACHCYRSKRYGRHHNAHKARCTQAKDLCRGRRRTNHTRRCRGTLEEVWSNVRFWRTMKGNLAATYPKTVYVARASQWGLSYQRYSLVLSEDTTTPYSILHVGPFEFFIRPKSIIF